MADLYPTSMLIEQGYISPRLASMILVTCPSDGHAILRNKELTYAKCQKQNCRNHMKHRADALLKHLGKTKGIGPESCLNIAKAFKLETHFEVMAKVYEKLGLDRPSVFLWEIGKFAFVPGISNELEDELSGYWNFEEYFAQPNPDPMLYKMRTVLINAQKYFVIKPPLSRIKIEVMITGSISGYSPRETFITHVNDVCGRVVRVVLKGKKQSVNYLITEDKQVILASMTDGLMNGKTDAAFKGGVQVVTPREFLVEMKSHVEKIMAKSANTFT